jgi:hypothetical protein
VAAVIPQRFQVDWGSVGKAISTQHSAFSIQHSAFSIQPMKHRQQRELSVLSK